MSRCSLVKAVNWGSGTISVKHSKEKIQAEKLRNTGMSTQRQCIQSISL